MLTVADIRAVGPATWNGWKGQLLRTLYYEVLPIIEGRYQKTGASERVEVAKAALRRAAGGMPADVLEHFIERHYDDYWLRTDTKRQLDHLKLASQAVATSQQFAMYYATDAFTAVTELTVLAPNHPRLLSLFAGACAAAGANIVGAHIATTRDGAALDTFLLKREFEQDEDEQRRARRIGEMIEKLLRGEVMLGRLLGKRREAKGPLQAFSVQSEAVIDNQVSDQFTLIEVVGLDRPGLLYEVTAALSDLNLDITSAHITTFGERAVDAFYVTDLTSKKIVSPDRQQAIKAKLESVLGGEPVSA
jgi:[protein-PII] uridylyltransferase